MTDDILTADAPPFREIPTAIEILEEHDAFCSYEAAVLLRATLGILTVPSVPEEVYDILIDAIGRIASLSDRHWGELPAKMQVFLDRVDEATADYLFGEAEAA